ncbi:MAG: ZIP family metal transporter [Balneolaceae bacterium]
MTGSATFDVFIYAMFTAIATGLGAIPFFFLKNITRSFLGISNAAASGLMLAASFSLIFEGMNYDLFLVCIGLVTGLVFVLFSQQFLNKYDHLQFAHKNIADGRKILLIVAVMTVHSFTEGVGVGVAFGGGEAFGIFITAAIALHNIPEGLAISLVMVPRGASPWKAVWWSIFSSLPQPLMAVPAFLFVEIFERFLPVGLGFAAGAMIWMVVAELIPDALKDTSPNKTGITIVIAIIFMLLFQYLLL